MRDAIPSLGVASIVSGTEIVELRLDSDLFERVKCLDSSVGLRSRLKELLFLEGDRF